MTSITSFLKSRLEAWIPFEEIPGLEFKIAYLSREEITKIRDAATVKAYNPRLKSSEEKFDVELFAKLLVSEAVVDWKGLTLSGLTNLVPIEVPADIPLDSVVEYSKEEAKVLFSNSAPLELWLNSIVSDLETFRAMSKK